MSDLASMYAQLRRLMFSIAYRMLGSVSEAEDVVQEAFLRLHTVQDPIASPEAYAATVTTRLAIDQLRSARLRREDYVGTWLPEPLVSTDKDDDPATTVEQAFEVSMAFLVLLERLSPIERAVFVLREVFGYSYHDIAQTVHKTEANCRQILRRAHDRINEGRPRFEASAARRDDLVEQFFAACSGGDLETLEHTLAEDVIFYADGGGKAAAVSSPIHGRSQVARFVLGLVRHALARGWRVERVLVNAGPGARLVDEGGNVLAVLALHVSNEAVQSLYNVVNPDKLRHLSRQPQSPSGEAGRSPD